MKGSLRIGTVGEERIVVSEQHLIDFAHEGTPQILCTPWLIWFLERAAHNVVLPLLEPGESTVGVALDLEHTAATPLRAHVICQARVICNDGPQISFQIEAHDAYERIARGTHKLRVIQTDRLTRKVAGKTPKPKM
jgi:fluoroacetyl-CoA thioesterase